MSGRRGHRPFRGAPPGQMLQGGFAQTFAGAADRVGRKRTRLLLVAREFEVVGQVDERAISEHAHRDHEQGCEVRRKTALPFRFGPRRREALVDPTQGEIPHEPVEGGGVVRQGGREGRRGRHAHAVPESQELRDPFVGLDLR